MAWRKEWAEDFLSEMKKRNVPIDFFSWHIDTVEPSSVINRAETVEALLKKYGYENAENILNEWNYVRGWLKDDFRYSIQTISNCKGAAFIMAVISSAQNSPIDLLMYYDARPCVFNGLFDMYFLEPQKGYYPFKWYGMFYGLKEIRSNSSVSDVYTLCGADENGKTLTAVTYYTDKEDVASKTISIDFGRKGNYEIFLLDGEHDGESVGFTVNTDFTIKPNTCILIKEQ